MEAVSNLENLTLEGRRSLKLLLAANKRIHTAYLLKESFGQLWDYTREGWAQRFFENWRNSLKWQRLKPYEKFARMIERHWDGIAAHCRTENKVALGFVEGLNNKIRVIQRRAYGLMDRIAGLTALGLTLALGAGCGGGGGGASEFVGSDGAASCLVPESQLVSGGPGRDGIPALTNPVFVTASEGNTIVAQGALVLGVVEGGEARAYPHNVLWHHEIINDPARRDPDHRELLPPHGQRHGLRVAD